MRISNKTASTTSKLGSDALTTLKAWYEAWSDATSDAQDQANLDRDYYDGIQWTGEEVAELERRNQPVLTINLIAPKLNFIIGAEIRGRTDPRAYPRSPDADAEAADACSDALRYVDDVEKLDQKFSAAAQDGLIQGAAAAVIEIDKQTLDPKIRIVHWDRFWWDHHSREPDFSDAKYLGVVDWLDYDDALEFYGEESKAVLDATAAGNSDSAADTHEDRPSKFSWYDKTRERIRVSEVYWREGSAWFFAHFTGGGFLRKPAPVPYETDTGLPDCPVVAWSAFSNRQNERYGIVRAMRSPQDEVNKRRSKALHLLSNRQVIAERGAVDSPESARHEVARPDGYIEVTPGLRFELAPTGDFTAGQLQLLGEAKAEISQVGPSAAIAPETPAASGRLFLARQSAANQQLEPVFDAFRTFKRNAFAKIWYRIRQFWTFEKWVRIRDDEEKNGFRFVGLNRRMTRAERVRELMSQRVSLPAAVGMVGLPDAPFLLGQVQAALMPKIQMAMQQGAQISAEQAEQLFTEAVLSAPVMQSPIVVNDISRLGVDIILDEVPDTAVVEQEEFEQLGAIGPTLIQSGFPPQMFAELLIEASQFRNRKKMLEIIRKASAPNPEAAQMQQQAAAMAQQKLAADIKKTLAQANQANATAQKTAVEAQLEPAKAQSEVAYAWKTAAEAGRATVPELQPQAMPADEESEEED